LGVPNFLKTKEFEGVTDFTKKRLDKRLTVW